MYSETLLYCAPSHLSGVSPMLPLNQFQCSSPIIVSLKTVSVKHILSTPLSSRGLVVWSLALCLQVVPQARQHFRHSEMQFLRRLLCLPVYPPGHFSWLQNVQNSTSAGIFKGGCQTVTHANLGFQFHFLWNAHWICEEEDVRPLDAIHQRACMTASASFSSWRLRFHQLHCFHREWLHLAWQWSPTLTGLGWLCLQCKLSDPAVCYFLKCPKEVLEKVWYLSHSLLCLSTVSWHTGWIMQTL